MQPLERASILLALAERLRANGSWTGETHIQKAAYFLEALLGVPLNLDFILYKHGPYSFDLTSELANMQANSLVSLRPQLPPYGPTYVPGTASALLKSSFGYAAEKSQREISFVAQQLGSKPVAELETIATALYVTLEQTPADRRAARIHELKPHVTIADAERAVRDFEALRTAAANQGLRTAV